MNSLKFLENYDLWYNIDSICIPDIFKHVFQAIFIIFLSFYPKKKRAILKKSYSRIDWSLFVDFIFWKSQLWENLINFVKGFRND